MSALGYDEFSSLKVLCLLVPTSLVNNVFQLESVLRLSSHFAIKFISSTIQALTTSLFIGCKAPTFHLGHDELLKVNRRVLDTGLYKNFVIHRPT